MKLTSEELEELFVGRDRADLPEELACFLDQVPSDIVMWSGTTGLVVNQHRIS